MDGAELSRAWSDDDFGAVERLGRAFAAWDAAETARVGLPVEELFGFQHDYRPDRLAATFRVDRNRMFLARIGGRPIGCAGFLAFGPGSAELKTLWVEPEGRGRGIARALLERVLHEAGTAGHRRMLLETVDFMSDAIALYRAAGFRDCAPYYEIPASFRAVTVFMERPIGPD